ncbi:hypothetical protein Tsubulata_025308 [Turnera subulata]|uniref:RRM domain-containing protein n=1 Tax=Turnera subulata TaxID=218843 RepID=A0A9Q0G2Z7_9ROSI|nr:hypothetical protein Tsubulata_025308 [Turnera subulata]
MSPTLPAPPHPSNLAQTNPSSDTQPQPTRPNQPLPYFSKWSRQQVQKAIANGQVYNIYVQNLSNHWSPTEVYRIMSRYGEVVDVYIPRKVAKNGQRFGFVHFKSNCDLQRLLLDVNKVQVEERSIQANIAREHTGVARDPRKVGSILLLWKLHGLPDVEVSDLGKTENRKSLGGARVEVLTEQGGMLNKALSISMGGQLHSVDVVEELGSHEDTQEDGGALRQKARRITGHRNRCNYRWRLIRNQGPSLERA